MSSLTSSPEWKALQEHQPEISGRKISDFFAKNPNRFQEFSVEAAGILLDYSKNLVDASTMALLLSLAEKAGMSSAITSMFAGNHINNTEDRPALHVALRSPHKNSSYEQEVHATLDKMESFVSRVTAWEWQGYKEDPITDVVNIGIGGSDLGPAMVYTALSDYQLDGIRCHFVSNVDPVHLEETLEKLEPATTLFVIASKSFTTLETSLNAQASRRWFLEADGNEQDLAKHFVAVSANKEKAQAFGIADENIFPMWDWVGGRYSLWSAIGLPVALGIGIENFRNLLAGAYNMDMHFQEAELAGNIPVIMGLLDTWYNCFCQAQSKTVLPYRQQLHLLPAWMQQLSMESLGKAVDRHGNPIEQSGNVIWGSAGTNGQHSFHQLLHQGTLLVPADFIAVAGTDSENKEQHKQLLANCLAQSQVLMAGRESNDPHIKVAGNKPSNTFLLDNLTPESLGSLLAAYEHSVYVQSILMGINAFDQFGVEAGKVMSKDVYEALTGEAEASGFDASTNSLINRCKK